MKACKNVIYALLLFLLISCKGQQSEDDSSLPISRGAPREILLVMDSTSWAGKLGDEIREVFMKTIPGLPQPEPYFDLKQVSPFALNQVLLNSRNILYVATLDNNSPASNKIKSYFTENSINRIREDSSLFMHPKKNEFARGQDVLYLFGNTRQELINNLENNSERLRDYFQRVETDRLKKKLYAGNEQENISKQLLKKHQFYIKVPYGYELVPNDSSDNFVWLRQLGQEVDKSLFVYYQDYTSESVFNTDNILALRNRITKKNIADSENVYMMMQDVVPVEFDTVTFNGKYAIEARGLWKLSNNSMGGPFLSYTFVDEELGRLYYIEGFVYSPGTKKRPHISEIEAILKTFKTESEYKSESQATS